MLTHELKLWNSGINLIAGVDEAGRGPLAGPIVAAAVILNRQHLINDVSDPIYQEIKDSKKLTAKKRGELFDFITQNAIAFSIAEISSEEIDKVGVGPANKLALFNAIFGLKIPAEHVLTDYFKIAQIDPGKQTNIKRGDSLSLTIAAASILAKVHRDNLMTTAHKNYTQYGFDRHKGYGTAFHREMITKYGPCELHRQSFTLLV